MKTAITIPDRLFEAAERVSMRLGLSRSAFYTKAVEAYVKLHRREGIREALDAVYRSESSELDAVLEDLQAEALRKDW
jgi:metal-responsive CopG/Arc/MetJ family transcriptional regulator